MSDAEKFAASLIEAGAAGYAAAAAERLIERYPKTAERFGAGAFRTWQAHLDQRLRELAAALVAGGPELLTAEVTWTRVAFEGRDVPLADLRASLDCLKQVLAEELPVAAGTEPDRYLEVALDTLDDQMAPAEPEDAADPVTRRLALAYLEACLSGDRRRAVEVVLSEVDGGLPVAAAYGVLMAAQREIGEMWHAGDAAIAQEHFVTATTQSLMTLLAERAGAVAAAKGKTVLVAVAPGDAHYLGARLIANLFEQEGWRTIHLAGTLPPEELALGLEAFAVDLLVLSLTVSTRLPATIEAVRLARRRRPGIKVLVGGRVQVRLPEACARIGADACAATADEAVQIGARLVGLS